MTEPATIGRRDYRWELLVIIVVALALRLSYAIVVVGKAPADTDRYLAVAENLVSGRGYSMSPDAPTAYRPPGYPMLIALVKRSGGGDWSLILTQCVLGALVAYVAAVLTRRLVGDLWALVAAVVVAVDPYEIAVSSLLMTEAFFSLLVAASVALLIRALRGQRTVNYATAGLVSGVGALTRPEWLLFAATAVWSILLWVPGKRRAWRVAVFVVAACLPLALWGGRNQMSMGQTIFTTTHGGYTHRLAYNAVFYDQVVSGKNETWPAESLAAWQGRIADETSGMSEMARDRWNSKMAGGFVAASAKRALRVALYEARSFWRPAPRPAGVWVKIGLSVFFLVLAALSVLGAYVAWRRGPFVAIALYVLAAETIVHMYYWSNVRMRVPFHPLLAVLAACAAASFFGRKAPLGATAPAVSSENVYSPAV